MKPQRLILALLAALLLFAQQAAYAHAISHLAGGDPPPKEQLGHAQLCGKCVSFEKVSAAAPASLAAPLSLPLHFAQPAEIVRAFRPATVAAFHSRAPPVPR